MRYLPIILLLLTSCRKTDDGWMEYVIEKGNHYCNGWKVNTCNPELKFEYILTESCAYGNDSVQPGVNKLYGFSNLSGNHEYSARLGWQYNDKINKVIIYWYAYVDGVRKYDELDTITLGSQNYGRVAIDHSNYLFQSNSHYKWIPGADESMVYCRQYPYFGGQSVCPHRMTILIRDL